MNPNPLPRWASVALAIPGVHYLAMLALLYAVSVMEFPIDSGSLWFLTVSLMFVISVCVMPYVLVGALLFGLANVREKPSHFVPLGINTLGLIAVIVMILKLSAPRHYTGP